MPASITSSSDPLCTSRPRNSRPISVSTSNWRRFSFGNRSVPPATNIAREPCSAAICAASRAPVGRRYLNRGSRSILGRWLDLDQGRIWNRREPRGTEARGFTLAFAAQRLDHLLRSDGYLVDPHAECVVHRGA